LNYKCAKCGGSISVRVKAERWITLKCDCEITIIYFDGCIKIKSREQYEGWKRKQLLNQKNEKKIVVS